MSFLGLDWSDLDPWNPSGKLGGLFSDEPPPAVPNYGQAAESDWTRQTAANRPNQETPWGSTSWTQGPDGQWTQTTSLSPEQQALLDQQRGLQGGRYGLAQGMFPQIQSMLSSGLPDGSQARDQAITAAYGQATSRLDPRFAQDEEALRTRLYNQGFREGDEAFNREMDAFGRTKNDAYTSAMNSAIGQGTAAGQSIFNQGLASNQNLFNMFNSLGSGPQVTMPQMPGFTTATSPNSLGAANMQFQGDLGRWNAEQASKTGLGDILNTAATVAPFFI